MDKDNDLFPRIAEEAEHKKQYVRAQALLQKLNALPIGADSERDGLIRQLLGRAGKNLRLFLPFRVDCGCNIFVGDDVLINQNCTFLDLGGIKIGNRVLIAPDVKIYSVTHPLCAKERCRPNGNGTVCIKDIKKPVHIGDDVWIGGGAIILPGVTIGNNAIVGAGSVVTKDIPDNVIVAGNPARIIKENKDQGANVMVNFNFYNPTRIVFGSGKLSTLSKQVLPGKKAMLLISNGKSAKVNGSLDKVKQQLAKAGVEYAVFDKIMENPVKEVIMEGAAFARENGCDFILALGGGAVLDSSKAIAAMATNDGDLWDYVNGGTGKGKPLANKGLPIVTIPTSSGTGSEVNCWGVISNLETKEKIGFGAECLVPVLSVVDPELMKTVPPKYTAYQGFDALFHNTEVMMSSGVNVFSEAIALSAIENIAKYLPRAVKDGKDIEAREHVAYAATVAGITMQLTSTTAQHSMEHAMSAYHHNLPHGAGLIMISVEFARYFIEKHACDGQFIKMARAMGMPEADKPEDFLTALIALQKTCGVDDLKMSDYGIQKNECMTLAVNARETMGGLFLANPCEMTDADCAGVFEKSYK